MCVLVPLFTSSFAHLSLLFCVAVLHLTCLMSQYWSAAIFFSQNCERVTGMEGDESCLAFNLARLRALLITNEQNFSLGLEMMLAVTWFGLGLTAVAYSFEFSN